MNRPMVRIHDIETDEIIDREMNDAEFEKWKTEQSEKLVAAEIEAQNVIAKAALLEKLGITEEEAKLLLS